MARQLALLQLGDRPLRNLPLRSPGACRSRRLLARRQRGRLALDRDGLDLKILDRRIHRIAWGGGIVQGGATAELVHQIQRIGGIEDRTAALGTSAEIQLPFLLGRAQGLAIARLLGGGWMGGGAHGYRQAANQRRKPLARGKAAGPTHWGDGPRLKTGGRRG